MKRSLILFSILCLPRLNAQTWVQIPDGNFAWCLQVNVPGAMLGNSLNITSTLVTNTHTLNANFFNVYSLSGIQYFTSLTHLYCAWNNLTTLPILPNSIKYLECRVNPLNTLPPLPNSLTYLGCNYSNLTTLPALPNSLQILSCIGSSLTNLPVLPNSLQILLCDSNNISCFPAFPNSLVTCSLNYNPYNCLPNCILPAMNNYSSTPLCPPNNTNHCAVVSIKELNLGANTFTVYPNPTTGQFIIETSNTEKQNLQLFDLNSRLVLEQNIIGKTIIDAGNLTEGVYNLIIKSNESILNKKIVIVR